MSSRPVLTVLAATAAAAALALPAQASALAAPSTPATAAATARTASHPAPQPFRAAVAAVAQHGVTGAAAHTLAAGVRPIGAGVSTDLPTRIEVGGPDLFFNYTVKVPTGSLPAPAVEIALATAAGHMVLTSYTNGTPGQTTYSGLLAVPFAAVDSLGSAQWIVAYGDSASDQVSTAHLGTTIKLRSLLGEKVTRTGNTVHVVGAAKEYFNEAETYIARPAATVAVQRWSGTGWVTVRTVRTDSRGHLDTSVTIPWHVGIRLSAPDTPFAFGAVTPSAAI